MSVKDNNITNIISIRRSYNLKVKNYKPNNKFIKL